MTPVLTFHDHVQELRRRLAWLVLTIGGGAVTGYVFRMPLIRFLQHPLGAPLFYTSPAGSFNFILKVSTTLGIVMALPLIVYHLIRFIEPALPTVIKRSTIIKVIVASTLLAVLGLAFGFFIMIPMSLHFFSSYSTATIKPLISVDEYLSFVLSLLLTFAALFQIPLVILFINRFKPIPPRKLLRYQRHIVVGAFVVAVILPFTYDPVSQLVMAVPIVFLYYLSIILVWFANRRVVYGTAVISAAVQTPTDNAPAEANADTPAAKAATAPMVPSWQGELLPQVESLSVAPPAEPAVPEYNLLKLEPIATSVAAINPHNVLKLHEPEPVPVNPANLLQLTPPPDKPVNPANVLALEHLDPEPMRPLRPQNLLKLDQPTPPPVNPYNVLDLGNQS